MDVDFEELSNDIDLIARMKQFSDASEKINNMLTLATDNDFYEKLNNSDKIKFNLLMSYSLNSLFWMYLRAEGIDPSTHQIKGENDRLKKAMTRAQEIKDRKTIMPRVNKDAALRFVRSGLWKAKNKNNSRQDDNQAEQIHSEDLENWDEEDGNQPTPPINHE